METFIPILLLQFIHQLFSLPSPTCSLFILLSHFPHQICLNLTFVQTTMLGVVSHHQWT